jgi:hypothetical protein
MLACLLLSSLSILLSSARQTLLDQVRDLKEFIQFTRKRKGTVADLCAHLYLYK